ncbi:ATP-NAD kinase [Streptococcus pyogenes JRS4]|uniref:NAD kinase n=10 Tax=Streptococcus pyogenes TaxID=1314 RepID=NADK_STRP1|nr:NAD kinase [Streptococcus pyogenes]P0DD16.1 RecName: Full=NAD kinase; AltName: Full=ATP-dependent NAD kinase [Streptococcus pyogenes MGAS315]P0DD17.1 RecName: Full=NAD kinase; AltName: Full=ATP-dependent NAD kinase [Streptococcus pyogenes SSI-1]P65781.1 RecName: Full=NAD kinase; AltName: Full=ATP-dependent NAD kinase [Streptococcus pyogenes serotype M1]P65783.1 RecName: Full=NAD kinase; AltName: Full=ATP-dependent NAD kinase [Streptococcus pyogenes MGAS8232]Q5XC82.2 RecName: Full=NAD kinase
MTQMNYTGKVKRVAIIANGKYQSKRVASKLFSVFKDDPDFYLSKKNPDIVISIGGDGMLLSAFHMYEKELDKVRFVGIHTGHLGFYTDYRDFEVDKLIDNLRKDKGEQISYPILKVAITLDDGRVVKARALNEATVKRIEKTMVADVIINHVKFESFRGDGISVSTPTGSTAYNKSLGGAVLHPTIEALQLTEISSLNNRVFRTLGSSIIIPKKDKIELVPKRLGIYTISIDNKTYQLKNVTKVEYFIDDEKIHFVSSPSHTSFWERVKDAFIGEIDS